MHLRAQPQASMTEFPESAKTARSRQKWCRIVAAPPACVALSIVAGTMTPVYELALW